MPLKFYFSYELREKSGNAKSPDFPTEARTLWMRYIVRGRSLAQFSLIATWTVVFWQLLVLLAHMLGLEPLPGRGNLARQIHAVVGSIDLLAVLILTFLVVDASLFCLEFVRNLTPGTLWPQRSKTFFIKKFGLDKSSPKDISALDDWINVQFIAIRTRCITKLIYYPFMVIALNIFAHSPLFGNVPLSVISLVVTGLSIAILVGCAVALYRAADRVRRIAMISFSDEMIKTRCSADDARMKQWEMLLERIANMQEGSFRPFRQQPVVGALLFQTRIRVGFCRWERRRLWRYDDGRNRSSYPSRGHRV
jgi:hypothetical protein